MQYDSAMQNYKIKLVFNTCGYISEKAISYVFLHTIEHSINTITKLK